MNSAQDIPYEGRDLEAMWFAKNYYQWIETLFAPYLRGRGIEVGAGTGNFTERLLSYDFDSLAAVEPSQAMHARLKEKFRAEPRVVVYNSTLPGVSSELPHTFDVAVYINVLEHVEDDAKEMACARSILKDGGYICVFVPALSWLYSDFDRTVGHYRRYYKKELEQVLTSNGFEIVRSSYFDFAGIWPWLVFFKIFGLTLSGNKTRLYDRYVVPVMRVVEAHVPVPIGKNLLVVARKK